MARLDLSGKLNRLDEMLGQKGDEVKKRVRVIYADLRADINDQLSKDIGDIQVIIRACLVSNRSTFLRSTAVAVLTN